MTFMTIRLDDEVKAQVQRDAGRCGLSSSAYVRMLLSSKGQNYPRENETLQDIFAMSTALNNIIEDIGYDDNTIIIREGLERLWHRCV